MICSSPARLLNIGGFIIRNLLLVEDFLVWGGSIGWCPFYPFAFATNDTTPIKNRATPLLKEVREWVREHVD